MATLGSLVITALILGLQFWHASHLDRTLPKRKTLPLWGRSGAHMERRWWALRAYPCFSALMAVILLGIAISQDLDPAPVRSTWAVIAVFAYVMLLFALLQALNTWRLKRWFRQGKPPLH